MTNHDRERAMSGLTPAQAAIRRRIPAIPQEQMSLWERDRGDLLAALDDALAKRDTALRERDADRAALADAMRERDEARAALTPRPCVMTHTEPYDFAACETHDTTFALGDRERTVCRVVAERDVEYDRRVQADYDVSILQDRSDAILAAMDNPTRDRMRLGVTEIDTALRPFRTDTIGDRP